MKDCEITRSETAGNYKYDLEYSIVKRWIYISLNLWISLSVWVLTLTEMKEILEDYWNFGNHQRLFSKDNNYVI